MRIKPRHLFIPAIINLAVIFGGFGIVRIVSGFQSDEYMEGIFYSAFAIMGVFSLALGLAMIYWLAGLETTPDELVIPSALLLVSGIGVTCLYTYLATIKLACHLRLGIC